MSELVLYRKYRPRSFAEFVGQEHVVKTLTNALALEKVAHAYLFAGPRGIGKTTIARIFAKAVNCGLRQQPTTNNQQPTKKELEVGGGKLEVSSSFEPCNKCSACLEIGAGRSLDLIEIDAASNRGIDEIRELRDGIKFSPTRLKYKVFIIDEVHQLTKEAFNALLKTLEEPPSHALFILATTELHKVPETIVSRCQHFNFYKLTIGKIVERLAQIAKLEGIKIEKQALDLIALNADGAMRDAESLLGQIMAMSIGRDKNITLEEVKTLLGTVDASAVVEMINYLAVKDMQKAITFVNKISAEGYDLGQFAKSLTSYLRKTMILKVDAEMAELAAPELTEEQRKIILEHGQKFSYEELNKLIRLFIRAEYEIKSAVFPQLPLELVIVEVADIKANDAK
ncbi:MAG: DNA polymerase III subunit gamma/tau [Candidatus Portnoybacteria bacterium]|nr:DNA polymerase III subunit gamma/tau [Candidatus Portnoybacteria bacterium]